MRWLGIPEDPGHAFKVTGLNIMASVVGVFVGLLLNYLFGTIETLDDAKRVLFVTYLVVGLFILSVSIWALKRTYNAESNAIQNVKDTQDTLSEVRQTLDYTQRLLKRAIEGNDEVISLKQAQDEEMLVSRNVENAVVDLGNDYELKDELSLRIADPAVWDEKASFYEAICTNILRRDKKYTYFIPDRETRAREAGEAVEPAEPDEIEEEIDEEIWKFIAAILQFPYRPKNGDLDGPEERKQKIVRNLEIIIVNEIEIIANIALLDPHLKRGFMMPLIGYATLIVKLDEPTVNRARRQFRRWRRKNIRKVNIARVVDRALEMLEGENIEIPSYLERPATT